MKVKDVMNPDVIVVNPTTLYEEAARILHENKFSGVPVVDENRRLVGMISEKDLFKALYPRYEEYLTEPTLYYNQEAQEERIKSIRHSPVHLYMSAKVVTIHPDAPILKAGGIMLARGIHRLPVVEQDILVGLVTREHIYRVILKQHLGF